MSIEIRNPTRDQDGAGRPSEVVRGMIERLEAWAGEPRRRVRRQR